MQVKEDIHALKIPFEVATPGGNMPRFVYVYLITGEKICLIDSGVSDSENIIFDYLKEIGLKPNDLSLLILTHSHPDHIGAAAAIKRKTGCRVAAHAAEKAWIEDINLQARERPVPGFFQLVGGPVAVDSILEDKDVLDLGGDLDVEVIHTQGHSAGSISLWIDKHRTLFSADAIPIAGDLPIYEDILSSVRSLQRLKALPEIDILLASWDDPQQGSRAYQRIEEGIDYLERIHKAVRKSAKDNSSTNPMELCRQVLGELDLLESLANPLIARSFQASLKAGVAPDLILKSDHKVK
jgi:hydroxyacylglutathione hydrolase